MLDSSASVHPCYKTSHRDTTEQKTVLLAEGGQSLRRENGRKRLQRRHCATMSLAPPSRPDGRRRQPTGHLRPARRNCCESRSGSGYQTWRPDLASSDPMTVEHRIKFGNGCSPSSLIFGVVLVPMPSG